MMTQTAMPLLFGTAQDARVPELGASGAIAAVLDGLLRPLPGLAGPHVHLPVFLVRIPAWIGGFIFGLLARLLAHAGQVTPGDRLHSTA
jgi:hypothetical protein